VLGDSDRVGFNCLVQAVVEYPLESYGAALCVAGGALTTGLGPDLGASSTAAQRYSIDEQSTALN